MTKIEIFANTEMNSTEKQILLFFKMCKKENNKISLGYQQISDATNIKTPNVIKYIKTLVSKGFIKKKLNGSIKKAKRQGVASNCYEILK